MNERLIVSHSFSREIKILGVRQLERYGEDSEIYWSNVTADKIDQYISDHSLSKKDRDKIFTDHIWYAFDCMIRISIKKHGFWDTEYGENIEELVQYVHFKTYQVLEKSRKEKNKYYDPSKGSSFSYFNRVIKNYLIQKQQKDQRNRKSFSYIEADPEYWESRLTTEERFNYREFVDLFADWLENNQQHYFSQDSYGTYIKTMIYVLRNETQIESRKELNICIMNYLQREGGSYYYKVSATQFMLSQMFEKLMQIYIQTGNIDIDQVVKVKRRNKDITRSNG